MEVDSVKSQKYFVTIMEEHSQYVALRPMKSNAQAANEVWHFVKYFAKQSGLTVRRLHTDGETEFRCIINGLKNEGVHVSVTLAHTTESMGWRSELIRR